MEQKKITATIQLGGIEAEIHAGAPPKPSLIAGVLRTSPPGRVIAGICRTGETPHLCFVCSGHLINKLVR